MLQAPEHLPFKGEAFPVVFIRVDHFFERKALLANPLISHQVDRTGPALAEQGLDHVATSSGVLYDVSTESASCIGTVSSMRDEEASCATWSSGPGSLTSAWDSSRSSHDDQDAPFFCLL